MHHGAQAEGPVFRLPVPEVQKVSSALSVLVIALVRPTLETKHSCILLGVDMEELRVERWLNPASPAASRALRSPSFRLTAIFQELDEEGELKGFRESSFQLAAASSSPRNRIFYGKVDGNPNYFVIGSKSYSVLKASLLDTAEP